MGKLGLVSLEGRRLRGEPHYWLQLSHGRTIEQIEPVFSKMHSERTKGNGHMVLQRKFPLDLRKTPIRVVQCTDMAQKRDGICILEDSAHLNKTLNNLP